MNELEKALEEKVFEEMNRRFDLHREDDDFMRADDTQIGVEFAIEIFKEQREKDKKEFREFKPMKEIIDDCIEAVEELNGEFQEGWQYLIDKLKTIKTKLKQDV
jgi:hypothetical protein